MAREEQFKYLKIRRIVQTISVFVMNPFFIVPFLNHSLKRVCIPVMNCWSCPAAAFACPIGAIGYPLAAGFIPYLTIGIVILVGVLIGRMLCGWICPFGFMQDLIYKIKTRKFEPPRVLRYSKYVILIVFVFLAAAFLKNTTHKAFFCSWCPAGSLEAALPVKGYEAAVGKSTHGKKEKTEKTDEKFSSVPDTDKYGPLAESSGDGDEGEQAHGFFPFLLWLVTLPQYFKFWVLFITIVGAIYMSRFFCRIICPIGAMFAVFNKFSFYDMRKAGRGNCVACGSCYGDCTLDPMILPAENSPECIRCLDCLTTPCDKDYDVFINQKWCKRCSVCTAFCPSEVFTENDFKEVTVAHPEKCTGCGWCTKLCPDFAVTVKEKGTKVRHHKETESTEKEPVGKE